MKPWIPNNSMICQINLFWDSVRKFWVQHSICREIAVTFNILCLVLSLIYWYVLILRQRESNENWTFAVSTYFIFVISSHIESNVQNEIFVAFLFEHTCNTLYWLPVFYAGSLLSWLIDYQLINNWVNFVCSCVLLDYWLSCHVFCHSTLGLGLLFVFNSAIQLPLCLRNILQVFLLVSSDWALVAALHLGICMKLLSLWSFVDKVLWSISAGLKLLRFYSAWEVEFV